MLIGLLGYKQSGKSTAANYLVEAHDFVEYSWAWPLKEVIGRHLFHLDDEILYGDSPKREEVIPKWGMSGRKILQVVGTDLFRNNFDPDFWVKCGEDQILGQTRLGRSVVVSDCRFPNEVDKIKQLGGTTIRIIKLGQTNEDLHESETALDDYVADHTIVAPMGGIKTIHHHLQNLVEKE